MMTFFHAPTSSLSELIVEHRQANVPPFSRLQPIWSRNTRVRISYLGATPRDPQKQSTKSLITRTLAKHKFGSQLLAYILRYSLLSWQLTTHSNQC